MVIRVLISLKELVPLHGFVLFRLAMCFEALQNVTQTPVIWPGCKAQGFINFSTVASDEVKEQLYFGLLIRFQTWRDPCIALLLL